MDRGKPLSTAADETAPHQRGVRARPAAAVAGVVAGMAAGASWYAAPDAPWWMYPFLGAVGFLVIFRLLHPSPRKPGWEDEL